MFCKYINCLCSTRFLLTVNILCSSILEVIKIYIPNEHSLFRQAFVGVFTIH